MKFRGWIASLACLCLPAPALADDGAAAGDLDFFRESVAPIIERHCISCHQGDEPKGGLSLSTSQSAAEGGESGAAFVAGDADASLLIEYVSGDKPEMPKDAEPLSAEQVAAL